MGSATMRCWPKEVSLGCASSVLALILWSLIYPAVVTGPPGHSPFLKSIRPKPVISSDVLGSLHSQTRASKYLLTQVTDTHGV